MRTPVLMLLVLISAGMLSAPRLMAQDKRDHGGTDDAEQTEFIEQARRTDDEYRHTRAQLEERARNHRIPMIMEDEDGISELKGFTRNNLPLYNSSTNHIAAQSSSTNQLYSWWGGGPYSFSLSGTGITLGEWDAGAVLATHQEFTGRVLQIDSPPSTHYHATHVAGTMVAAGVDTTARGMSYAARLHAYDWNNAETEMAAAAANGLQVSNHSYGLITGWYSSGGNWYWFGDTTISTTEDYRFGAYTAATREWDSLAAQYPYYLICKSAGNDRNDVPPSQPTPHYVWDGSTWTLRQGVTRDQDGGSNGFDCITERGISKNILTIGAVNDIPGGWTQPSDVVMSSFSGWGPTDDGRIKPDIVANGIGLKSTYVPNNTSYASLSGTSMSSPAVAGSIGLLHQHQQNLHPGMRLLAATVKALVIHTADEAGTNDGPDYSHGWGMLNTHSAAKSMSDNAGNGGLNIHELTLAQSGTVTMNVVSDGSPLKATICWTDPEATPPPASLNPTTPMLVNDLDMRITHPAPTTYYPWILNPASPASAATTGDNFRDNVEVVFVQSPVAGATYTVTITHKGSLTGGSQDFSLIVTGITSPTNTPPVADAGPDQTIDCAPIAGASVTLDGSASTDADGDPLTYTWTEGAVVLAGPTSSATSVVTLAPGSHTVLLTVNDGNGGTDTSHVNITVNPDLIPPTVVVNITPDTLNNEPGLCGASGFGGSISWSDNCRLDSTWGNFPGFVPVGTTTLYYGARDGAGNITQVAKSFTVLDVEAPQIAAPADVTVPNDPGLCGRQGSTFALGNPVASDNCGVAITNDAPAFFPVGNTTVTWTATDPSGNTATAMQTVTIMDVEPPQITPPPALTLSNDPGVCGKDISGISLGTPVVTDNCPGSTTTNSAPAFLPVGTTLITWTATDAYGNTSTATQSVTVNDTEPPTLIAPPDVTTVSSSWQCGSSFVYLGTPTVDDNCTTVNFSNNAPGFFPVGSTTVTWTAIDQYGNSTTRTQTVTVEDKTPPNMWVILWPQFLSPANQSMRTIRAYVGVSDNCGNASWVLQSVISNQPDANAFPGDLPNDISATTGQATSVFSVRAESTPGQTSRAYQVTYVATDGSGNTQTYTNYITVAAVPKDVVFSDVSVHPDGIELLQNYPNPFTGRTSMTFRLPKDAGASLRVYDALGREVAVIADGQFAAGSHAAEFDANVLPEGVYFYKLFTGTTVLSRKMLLVR